jgi:hypothetical protein
VGTSSAVLSARRTDLVTARLHREVTALRARRPRVMRVAAWATTHPTPILLAIAAVVGGVLQTWTQHGDAALFDGAASRLLGAHAFDVFASAPIQVGPLYLAALAALHEIAHLTRTPLWFVTGATQAAAVCGLATVALRTGMRRGVVADAARVLAVGLSLTAGGLVAEATLNGHLEEVATGLLLVIAGNLARRGNVITAGLIVAAAGDIKLWGLLGVAVLFTAPRRSALPAAAVALGAAALPYLPFFAFGHVHTFDYVWTVSGASTLGLLVGHGWVFDWHWRMLQSVAAVGAGVLLAVRGLRPVDVVAGLMTVRLLLDPQTQDYYATALVVVLIVAAWSSEMTFRARVAWAMVAPASALLPYLTEGSGGDVLRTVCLVGVGAHLVLAARTPSGNRGATGSLQRPSPSVKV